MEEKRKIHECIQEQVIGRFKEFMAETKGLKTTLFTVSLAIIIQVTTFAYLWGSLTTTVNKNTEHLWKTVTPTLGENTRSIDKILGKLDNVIIYAKKKDG